MTALEMSRQVFVPALDDDAELIAFLDREIETTTLRRDRITMGSDAYTADPIKVERLQYLHQRLRLLRALRQRVGGK